jgi:hypothetical protein
MNSKVENNYYQIVKQLNWWLGLSGRWYGLAFKGDKPERIFNIKQDISKKIVPLQKITRFVSN